MRVPSDVGRWVVTSEGNPSTDPENESAQQILPMNQLKNEHSF